MINLGRFELCLSVRDIKKSLAFYEKLDFQKVEGDLEEGWVILQQGNTRLGLYSGHFEKNLLNFRGGDVFGIAHAFKERGLTLKSDAAVEPDGSAGATIEDPDGNLIYFNTYPDEMLLTDQ